MSWKNLFSCSFEKSLCQVTIAINFCCLIFGKMSYFSTSCQISSETQHRKILVRSIEVRSRIIPAHYNPSISKINRSLIIEYSFFIASFQYCLPNLMSSPNTIVSTKSLNVSQLRTNKHEKSFINTKNCNKNS